VSLSSAVFNFCGEVFCLYCLAFSFEFEGPQHELHVYFRKRNDAYVSVTFQ